MSVTVSVHGKVNKMFKQGNLNRALYNLTNQVAADMDQFVPFSVMNHEHMANTVHVKDNHITYSTPYARAQFYGFINGHPIRHWTTSEHPQATKRWDLKAKSLYMKQWQRLYAKELKG